jgi:putative ABC transport system permease protein
LNGNDISWVEMVFGTLVIAIPIIILYYYRTGLNKPLAIAFLRMIIQLSLVGLYLEYIFDLNSTLVNIGWAVLMIFAAAYTIVERVELKMKYFFLPILIGIIAGILINGSIFAFILVGAGSFFDARYIIPIMGMLIGNSLNSAILGVRSFFKKLSSDVERYRYYLMCGATRNEALFQFISEAMQDAFSPTIASTATIGLIWLPGMMTGQILGGSDPITAIKFQIMIIITIFVGSVITLFISLNLSKRFVFDDYDMFDRGVYVEKKKK